MPLARYGVLIGTLFAPQEQTEQGNWFHGLFYLSVPGAQYPQQVATDFSNANLDNIQYKIFKNLNPILFSNIMSLPDGYHDLGTGPVNGPTSGAIDYVRSPLLGPGGCIEVLVGFYKRFFDLTLSDGWQVINGSTAVQDLQQLLNANPKKIYVFGEPYSSNVVDSEDGVTYQGGMHNVHMNQGDPATSSDGVDHQADDGIWQDGGAIFLNSDGTLTAFCTKFVTQTFITNDQGLPA